MSESLFSVIASGAARHGAAPAIFARDRAPLSHAALSSHVAGTIARLNALGIGRGDRVAIVLPSSAEMATVSLAVMAAAVAVPVNPDFKQAEYAAVFSRLAPRLLLALPGNHPARAAAVQLSIPLVDLVVDPAAPAGIFSLHGAGLGTPSDRSGPAAAEDHALILQTSGTTALPKIVPLTQRNLLASVANIVQSLALGPADRCLHFLPMFHIGGLVDVLLAPLSVGGAIFCAPSFSAPDFYRDLTDFAPTWTQAVPVMLEEMLTAAPQYAGAIANHRLRFIRSVSAPLPIARMAAIEQTFHVPVIEIYGMSETAGVVASNPLPPAQRKPGSVGIPVGIEMRLLGPEGNSVAAGETGEILLRGTNVISGYETTSTENAVAFSDGWFRTGDLGYRDAEGFVFLNGRVKDMINRGGEKVSPYELDEVLLSHPAVADAAAFAIPHPSLGEDIAAAVVLKPGTRLAASDLSSYLRERLAFFKLPRVLHFVEKIPRTPGGKLQRVRLTETLGAQGLGATNVVRPDFVAPATPVAKTLAALWQDILKVDEIGMDDDFFALGGDSLKAASFINALQQKWGDTIYVSSLFDAPTLAKYEHYLRLHYPELVARMLGQFMAPPAAIGKVTPAMVAALQGMIACPLGPYVPSARKNPRAIFVLSPPRSGSTLLRAMLAGHPRLFAPPELYLLSYENLADRQHWFSGSHRSQLEGNIRALMQIRNEPTEACQALMADLEARACPTQEYYGMLQQWLGDRILVDKTPAYAVDSAALERAELYFGNPIYIHLLRHPYGMIRSFEEAKLDQLWFPRLVGTDAHSLESFPFERRQLAEMVWLMLHRNILAFLRHVPPERQCRLRFEDIVSQPEPAMSRLCKALGLSFAPEMLTPQGDKKQRMTDGIHDVSRMIGDPKFHQYKKIESAVADQWKSAYDMDFLAEDTFRLAAELGYDETVASVRGRVEFEL